MMIFHDMIYSNISQQIHCWYFLHDITNINMIYLHDISSNPLFLSTNQPTMKLTQSWFCRPSLSTPALSCRPCQVLPWWKDPVMAAGVAVSRAIFQRLSKSGKWLDRHSVCKNQRLVTAFGCGWWMDLLLQLRTCEKVLERIWKTRCLIQNVSTATGAQDKHFHNLKRASTFWTCSKSQKSIGKAMAKTWGFINCRRFASASPWCSFHPVFADLWQVLLPRQVGSGSWPVSSSSHSSGLQLWWDHFKAPNRGWSSTELHQSKSRV